jgi:hypothetical protein
MIRPVGRKRENDPMKLFPYLFQFASPRLSDYKENGGATCDVDCGTPARLSGPYSYRAERVFWLTNPGQSQVKANGRPETEGPGENCPMTQNVEIEDRSLAASFKIWL